MRVLTIYYTNIGGGYFKRLSEMILALLKDGMEVHYISYDPFPITHKRLRFHRLPKIFRYKSLPWFLIASVFYCMYVTIRYNLDIFVAFGSPYSFIYLPSKIIFHVPLLLFIHGNWIREQSYKKRSRIYLKICEIIERIGLLGSTRLFTVTYDLRKCIRDAYNIEADGVLYNNIRDCSMVEANKLDDFFMVGFIGVFAPIKRIDVLIKSFYNISHEKVKLILVGTGPIEHELERLVKDLKIEEKVIFAGWKSNIADVLSSLDLLVLPSEYEGCPLVLLEALGYGVPCIGTKVGGITEILKYEELLFEPLNVNSLTDRLDRCVGDENFFAHITNLCLERKKKFVFDWDKEIISIIEETINANSINFR